MDEVIDITFLQILKVILFFTSVHFKQQIAQVSSGLKGGKN
jgi:hypothetical protein